MVGSIVAAKVFIAPTYFFLYSSVRMLISKKKCFHLSIERGTRSVNCESALNRPTDIYAESKKITHTGVSADSKGRRTLPRGNDKKVKKKKKKKSEEYVILV